MRMFGVIAPLAVALMLSACSSAPAPYVGKDYAGMQPRLLTVSSILIDDTTTAQGAPHIEQQLTPMPNEQVRAMLSAHYAVARPNVIGTPTIHFTITEASVTETALPQPEMNFFERMNSKHPEYRYEGRMVVESQASGAGAGQMGFIKAEATRSLEVRGLSPAERQRQVQGIVAQMVDDIAAQIDAQIDSNMSGHIISGESQSYYPSRSPRWEKVMSWK